MAQGSGIVQRKEEPEENNVETVALVFHGNPRLTNTKGEVNTSHGEHEYSKSAESAQKAIERRKSPDKSLFHIPTADKVLVYESHTKHSLFDAISEQKEDSISYMGIYSHGQNDQIVLGFMDFSDPEHPEDIDIHLKDIIKNAGMLRSRFRSGAIVELWGCNQGSGGLPVAQVLANAIGKDVKVYAYNSGAKYKKKNGHSNFDGTFIKSKKGKKFSRLEFTPKSFMELIKSQPVYDLRKDADRNWGMSSRFTTLYLFMDEILNADIEDGKMPDFLSETALEEFTDLYEDLLDYERDNYIR